MKRISTLILVAVALLMPRLASAQGYVPTEEILKSREEFADSKFGVFLHWGLYSMFAQGEWYMNRGIDSKEYSGYAFGMGIERITNLKYQVKDLRLFSENDVRFLKLFESAN